MARFLSRERLAALSDADYDALGSLHFAVNDLRHEWVASCAVLERMIALTDHADHADGTSRFSHRSEALSEVARAASRYSRAVEMAMWPCVSAYTVLGITILDRVVSGRAPLPSATVRALSAEPTLAELQSAVSIPVASLRCARSAELQASEQQEQKELLTTVEGVYFNLAHDARDKPLNREQAAACRLTEADDPGIDPLWDNLMDPLISLAEQNILEIGFYLARQD
ncbi:hypothetical protein AB0A71_40015 [Kitasatospora aureofaciens]|uniref:hypothetical protein n=1 Tax=Kitasatospora aureofaciens TaxID=1894 RepID=UPI0033C4ED58